MPADNHESAADDVGGFGSMFSDEQYAPPSCEVLDGLTPERVEALKAKGLDPIVRTIQVFRWSGGRRVGVGGKWPAEHATREWFERQFGAGQYEIRGCNAQGIFVCSNQVVVEGASMSAGPSTSGPSTLEGLALELLKTQLLGGAQRGPDPMREALADMVKMMGMSMQLQAQSVQQQQQMLSTWVTMQGEMRKPGAESEGRTFDLLKELIKSNASGGAASAGAMGSVQEAFELVKLGLSLGQAAGGEKKDDDEAPWLKHLVPIVDSLGPGLVATLAQATLPPEKSELVLKTINEHMRARQEEAKADTVIDTDGEEAG